MANSLKTTAAAIFGCASALALSACSPTDNGAPADHVNRTDLTTEMGRCNYRNGRLTIQNRYGAFIASGTMNEQRGDVAVIYDFNMRGYDPNLTDKENDWKTASPYTSRNLEPSNHEAAYDTKTGSCVIAFNQGDGSRTIVKVTMGGRTNFEAHPSEEGMPGEYSTRALRGEPLPETTFAPAGENALDVPKSQRTPVNPAP